MAILISFEYVIYINSELDALERAKLDGSFGRDLLKRLRIML